jgi:hypothetical protein
MTKRPFGEFSLVLFVGVLWIGYAVSSLEEPAHPLKTLSNSGGDNNNRRDLGKRIP